MMTNVAVIPWDETLGPLTDEIAKDAIGKPVTWGAGGDQIGTITNTTAEHDPDRLCFVYELDTKWPGSLSVEVSAVPPTVLGGAFIPLPRFRSRR